MDFMAAMMELGMTPSMKVAEVGAQDVEVYPCLHQDMREYEKMSDAMRESDAFKMAYQKAAEARFSWLIHSTLICCLDSMCRRDLQRVLLQPPHGNHSRVRSPS